MKQDLRQRDWSRESSVADRIVLSWQKNKSVETTAPGSKNKYKITYLDGQQKWTDDRPGDGEGGRREKMLQEKKQSRPSIKDAKVKLEIAYSSYVSGKHDEAALKQVVDDVIVKVGREVAREVIGDFVKNKGEVDGKAKEALGIIRSRKMERLRKSFII